MKNDNLSELSAKKIKFNLLFLLGLVLLYVLLVKFVIKVPRSDNAELLDAINSYEDVLSQQQEYQETIKNVHVQIDTMEYDIHQVQVQDEVSKRIIEIRSVYKNNNMNSKFKFGVLAANLLQIYFDTKQEYNALINNKIIIEANLEDCKGNIEGI